MTGFSPFGGHHADRGQKIGVVRDDGCRLEQLIPGVVQEMGRKIHVRAFLFHDVELRDHCVRQQGGCLASSLPSRATCGVAAHGQRLHPRPGDRVIARGQRHRPRCVDLPASHRQVDERTPDRLGEKAPEMHFHLRQRAECGDISMLASRRSWVRSPGYMGGEVKQLVHDASRRQHPARQIDRIQPLEWRPLEHSVVQVEAVDIDPRSHGRPRKSKGRSSGAALEPTARCQRVSARNLAPAERGCKQQRSIAGGAADRGCRTRPPVRVY